MRLRYVDDLTEVLRRQLAFALRTRELIGYGLRRKLAEGYTGADFRADLRAGAAVAAVSLPLSLALAVAAGVAPQHGLYTAIVAGVVVALLGGTRVQITGPTAAFVVILLPILHRYGLAGLLTAGMMAGVLLIAMGLARFGKLFTLIPHPVTTGFTAGIALVLALLQLKDVLGVVVPTSDGLIGYLDGLWAARGQVSLPDLGVAVVTVGLLVLVPRLDRRLPAPLLVLAVVAAAVALIHQLAPSFAPITIAHRFQSAIDGQVVHGLPPLPPMPMWPWDPPSSSTQFALDYAAIRALLPSALAIALLGAIESLATATVADGVSPPGVSRHEPNAELIALGVGNLVCPFFGGIPCTGALARTATNIRAGARSPLASAFHAVIVLACMLALAPLVSYLPMAALAGLLLVVARNLSEARHFARLMRIAPRADVGVLLTCFGLTVVFDMVVAVTVGVVMAALLFMRRMTVLTRVTLEHDDPIHHVVPEGVRVFQIAGPMFFGAAKTAMATLEVTDQATRTIVLNMKHVPTIDATGLVALESTLDRLRRDKRMVVLAGLQPDMQAILERADIKRVPGELAFAPDLDTAVSMAIVHAAHAPTG